MLKKLLSAVTGAIMLATTAGAGSDGFSLDDVAQIDILPGWRTENGTYMTALRVQLAPGWKTYWRAPGIAGIPPRFDWEGSSNISDVRFFWPAPKVYYLNGMQSIGYYDELVLPIELTPKQRGRDITIRAEIELGVCQDICVPVSVRVSADLIGSGALNPRIQAALKARPATSREAGMRGITCTVEPISDGLRLTARIDLPSLGGEEVAVFELPDQTIWVAEATARRQGRTLIAVTEMVPPISAPFPLDQSQVRITIFGSDRAVDIIGCTG